MDPPPTTTTTTSTHPQPQPTQPQPQPTLTQTQSQTQTQPQDSSTPTTNHTQTPFQNPPPPKLRLMCSYNGHIIPRPNTKLLCYVGGETRMISLDRTATISELLTRLSLTLNSPSLFSIKYQLPGEDLDSLISLSTDEDLDNMIDEYDRLNSVTKPGRIRLFLFPVKIDGTQSMGPMVDGSDDWFLNALNGTTGVELQRGYSDPGTGTGVGEVDCLIGLDHDFRDGNLKEEKVVVEKVVVGQDVQSVPDSKTSSFGSTSSTPTTFGSLPQIKVHVEGGIGGGIEEQFGQMNVGIDGSGQVQKQVDEGFGVISSSQPMINGFQAVTGGGEFVNRVYLEDGKQHQANSQQQMGMKPQLGADLPSPDSVSSDSSLTGAIARQKPVAYQDPNGQLSSGSTRFPAGIQVQQISESGYSLHPQYDPHQQIMFQPHQQLPQQQNFLQQQAQTQPQTQQQYIPAGPHFVHHPPPGAVPMPMPAYFPIYPHQQPPNHPHHYPVYYVSAPGYSLPGQQRPITAEAPTSIPSNRAHVAPPNPTIITTSTYNPPGNMNMEPLKSEMGPGGPQPIQVPSSLNQPSSQSQPQQHQYVGYSQIHHQSQTVAPNSGAVPGFTYEYYTQPQVPAPGSQYQGMVSSGPTMMMPEVSCHLLNDSVKQQTRSSQPL